MGSVRALKSYNVRMIRKYSTYLGGIWLLAAVLAAQGAQGPKVRILFPEHRKQRVAAQYMFRQPDGSYLQAGASGGSIIGSLTIPRPTDRPTDRLKARVWTPGCEIKAFDVPLADADIELQFVCDPEKTVPFRGRVVGPLASATIAAQYWGRCLSGWNEERENRQCLFPIFVATAKVEADGSFEMDLPDFKADPIFSSDSSAMFKFLLRIGDGGWRLMQLEGPKNPSVAVASSYPEDVIFVPMK